MKKTLKCPQLAINVGEMTKKTGEITELSWHIECVIDGEVANPANFHPLIKK